MFLVRNRMEKSGFTLIELLIVIAIILILISIALPNFLEAQIRAKVTKAEGEMRSIATAIEAYQTDWGHYPLDGDDYESFDPSRWAVREVLNKITTPIAYITEVPFDPFHQDFVEFGGGEQLLFPGPGPYVYSYNTPTSYFGGNGLAPNSGRPIAFGLTSFGPSLTFDSVMAQGALHYSATNGTKSLGDLLWLVGSGHPPAAN